jgi:hypothetical protein
VRIALALSLAACLLPQTAHAGRSFFGWLYGTEVMPERGVELQTWISEESGKYGNLDKQTSIWWGPLIGITDQLELSLPLELDWTDTKANMMLGTPEQTKFTFKRFGVEARYRLVSQDPVDAPAFAPLVRVAVKRDVIQRDDVRVEADLVASYDVGPVQVLVDLGFIGDTKDTKGGTQPAKPHMELRPGGGVSVRATSELRVGAEIYSEISVDSNGAESWATAGPNLSWTHGRFWLSGVFGIQVYHVTVAPRVVWGIAF